MHEKCAPMCAIFNWNGVRCIQFHTMVNSLVGLSRLQSYVWSLNLGRLWKPGSNWSFLNYYLDWIRISESALESTSSSFNWIIFDFALYFKYGYKNIQKSRNYLPLLTIQLWITFRGPKESDWQIGMHVSRLQIEYNKSSNDKLVQRYIPTQPTAEDDSVNRLTHSLWVNLF